MQIIELNLFDNFRNRSVPTLIYMPDKFEGILPVVIFGPGYNNIDPVYKNYSFLANYFVDKGYGFITIQHDLAEDGDGLETIDPKAVQHEAREHLYKRGVENIQFVIKELKAKQLKLNLQKFIIAGHSNGGDIAKYFTGLYSEQISNIILFDARRCRLKTNSFVRMLMFEADDTSTDLGVIPDEGTKENPKRLNFEWIIIKPKGALHTSYMDNDITDELKKKIFKALEFFLNE